MWGQDNGIHVKTAQHVTPVVLGAVGVYKFFEEGISVDISAAVHENAIFGVQVPNEIATPLVTIENPSRRMLLLDISYGRCRQFSRFKRGLGVRRSHQAHRTSREQKDRNGAVSDGFSRRQN